MALAFGPRRGIYIDILDEMKTGAGPLSSMRYGILKRLT